jgi:nicotinate-nucleotide pyrophosphorylase (carboxylating)
MLDTLRPPDPREVARIVRHALAEDRAAHDVTTRALVPADQQGQGAFLFKAPGVVCGFDVVRAVFAELSEDAVLEVSSSDGAWVEPGQVVAEVRGPLAPILSGERVALNLLQRMSGVATMAHRFVRAAAEGGPAQVLDTRKTTPGLRDLERYAVRVGGAHNHRNTLEDGVLIKDNHIQAARKRGLDIVELVAEVRENVPHTLRIEIEVTDAAMAREAIEADADIILLDNMSPAEMRQVIEDAPDDGLLFEASGVVSLVTVREISATGVHLISVCALTLSAPALDISVELEAL